MYFGTKSYLKNTRNHIVKHALSVKDLFVISKVDQRKILSCQKKI
jgi:hypothetical protein